MERRSITWVNGDWLEGNPPLLGPMSHAWWMASSVFDGARAFGRLVPDLDRHCARLIESAKSFHMTPPMTAGEMAALAWEGVERFPEDAELYIRPMMYFEDGFVVPDTASSRFMSTSRSPGSPMTSGCDVPSGIRTFTTTFFRVSPACHARSPRASSGRELDTSTRVSMVGVSGVSSTCAAGSPSTEIGSGATLATASTFAA